MTPINDDTAVLPVTGTSPEPEDDGFAAELAKAAPKRWWNRGTIVLGAVVLLVGGFVGGLQAQKQWGTSTTPAAGNRAAAFGNRAAGGFPAAGAEGLPAGGFGGANPGGTATTAAAADTTGTVKLVNGTTIYVEKADGTVVTVKTDGKTKVATSSTGKLSDVKAGQSVTIQGAAAADGSVTATSVTAQKK
ncbi:hypothetical protein Ade02nite_52220 [Paractinoplanes deccanensis]|uniref:DUF5666 domain-containing protein n=1 Tax=Paractinoplanes deccanensis TaxID=113561 RepID=A0ABQ3Y9A1_9ACTN|nr:hypothetical protein [Actinoplanes deccanensis]GID76581.1 hypothetical protein Ade02nite_52220 [Actinoplanes deccanensis]